MDLLEFHLRFLTLIVVAQIDLLESFLLDSLMSYFFIIACLFYYLEKIKMVDSMLLVAEYIRFILHNSITYSIHKLP